MKTVTIVTTCPFCGTDNHVEVEHERFIKWRAGALITDCFPKMDATTREILISGICPKCQDAIFG